MSEERERYLRNVRDARKALSACVIERVLVVCYSFLRCYEAYSGGRADDALDRVEDLVSDGHHPIVYLYCDRDDGAATALKDAGWIRIGDELSDCFATLVPTS